MAAQFLVESPLLGTLGGALGIGAGATYALAYLRGWQPLTPAAPLPYRRAAHKLMWAR